MGKTLRVRYYDLFSRFYDKFVELHSGDRTKKLRQELARQTYLTEGNTALDICTGTGSLLPNLQERVGRKGLVVGLDFSKGMLRIAAQKVSPFPNIALVQADAGNLPFRNQIFDALTCSHAFYELTGDAAQRCLGEVNRVLRIGSHFLMMEHDVPKNLFIRVLYYIRIFSMGLGKGLEVLNSEEKLFRRHLGGGRKITIGSGRTKIISCTRVEPKQRSMELRQAPRRRIFS
jgi:demethylmenaquinone methyltransferase/2-methoxy-6-polyprenyl-1,4-benzoquinol methylase